MEEEFRSGVNFQFGKATQFTHIGAIYKSVTPKESQTSLLEEMECRIPLRVERHAPSAKA